MPWVERGVRRMEKQEANSLRLALEDMDLQEEQRIHEAAQDEASSLVWDHRNPDKAKKPESAYKNPDVLPMDYRAHTRKESYGRAHGQAAVFSHHNRSKSLPVTPGFVRPSEQRPVMATIPDQVEQNPEDLKTKPPKATEPRKTKSYQGLANAVATDVAQARRRVSSGSKRKPSGGKGMMDPNDKIWEEPEEGSLPEAHEEANHEGPVPEPEKQRPEEVKPVDLPRHVRRNPFARVRFQQDKLERTNSAPIPTIKQLEAVEIQKNPPTQSRKPWYLSNRSAPPAPAIQEEPEVEDSPRMKDGMEIRGDDIVAATSMKRKDRSPNLPQPTAVSDSPGRPIVSFQPDWKPKEVNLEEVHVATSPEPVKVATPTNQSAESSPSPSKLRASLRRPSPRASITSVPDFHMGALPAVAVPGIIPTINIPDDCGTPSRVLAEEPDIPSIFVDSVANTSLPPVKTSPPKDHLASKSEPATSRALPSKPQGRPLPSPSHQAPSPGRPLPRPSAASPSRPSPHHSTSSPFPAIAKPHYTPSLRRNTALCAHCALPISGRILSAAGERFHPECFKCHQCGTNLECVAFYPEPDQKHYERIARIQQRIQGLEVSVPAGVTADDVQRLEEEDGDDSLRFFCHLDFHELFSPRCKSCKTPIEGEVVVACGAEWHVGHFFCAQCGDVSSFRLW